MKNPQPHRPLIKRLGRRVSTAVRIKRTASGKEIHRQQAKKQEVKRRRKDTGTPTATKKPPFKFLWAAIQRAKRERWAAVAAETQRIVLGDGKYVEERRNPVVSSPLTQLHEKRSLADRIAEHGAQDPNITRVEHDILAQIKHSQQGTTFYPHYSETLALWASSPRPTVVAGALGTVIEFLQCSTLTAAHRLAASLDDSDTPPTTIGVLSFASPKKPGGGFLHGSDEQEDTIARHSSLVASLSSPAAQAFYQEHKKYWAEDGSGLHDHSMVYSPDVVVFRADADDNCDIPPEDAVGGTFIAPYTINVLSAVPVNAAAVRAKHVILPTEKELFESGIRIAMKERMARALRAFEERGNRTLVLGAFGCGSSENNAETIGAIWAELLTCGDEQDAGEVRFKNVFDKVVFAVQGKFYKPFQRGYEMRILEAQIAAAALSD